MFYKVIYDVVTMLKHEEQQKALKKLRAHIFAVTIFLCLLIFYEF